MFHVNVKYDFLCQNSVDSVDGETRGFLVAYIDNKVGVVLTHKIYDLYGIGVVGLTASFYTSCEIVLKLKILKG